jgi:flagellar basal body-associated protein FliL
MSGPSVFEPGVVGVFNPIILLPERITEHLTSQELRAITAHELAHVRRHDNLTATVHMFVQAMFWFHPMIWWIGSRLLAERELACDEAVVKSCDNPETYAEGVLKVCKSYIESPLICAAGVSASNLSARIERIMTKQMAQGLSISKRLLIAAFTIAFIVSPFVAGWASAQAVTGTKTTPTAGPSNPVYYDLPPMVVNMDTGSHYLKLRVSLEIKCASPGCQSETRAIENVLPSIYDSIHEYVHGLKPADLQGKTGLARLRNEVLSRVNELMNPSPVQRVRFKEMLVTDKL